CSATGSVAEARASWDELAMASRASPPAKRRRKSQFDWAELPENELLGVRLRDLGLTLNGTWLETQLGALNGELKAGGILIRAHGWLSDEWFSPHVSPGVAFPFYLAHPRLMR